MGEISAHKYIKSETSHTLPTHKKQVPNQETNLSLYNYGTAKWKNIKTSLKQVKWNEIFEKCDSTEKKIIKIIEIIMKIIENNNSKFKFPRGSQTNKIPRDRKILLRKKKKFNLKLKRCNTRKKNCIESAIVDIDKK